MLVFFPQQLTDAGLALVCENCSTLQRLSISGCEGITDATLKKLGACCKKFRSVVRSLLVGGGVEGRGREGGRRGRGGGRGLLQVI